MSLPSDFVLRHTRLQPVRNLPSIRLYQADKVMETWEALQTATHNDDAPPPFWAFVWPGGAALARYVTDHPQEIRGKSVLDVAAGSGLAAIAASRAGAASVEAADTDPFCADVIALNARANGVHIPVTIRDPLVDTPHGRDVILAGDVFYEQPMASRMAVWLRAAASRGARVLMGDPGRAYRPAGLVHLADYDIRTVPGLEERELRRTGVYTFAGG
ncbi:MAG TPA: 50S ribosomal protein L11 methyltransferase [Chloroflexota bacterium]|nr:50S ribosomal protein L11 methyltransferase [Chloroflexota bacterium]